MQFSGSAPSILLAFDSFKGSLSSAEAAEAAEAGIRAVAPDAKVVSVAVADGGEGSAMALCRAMKAEWVEAETSDPLGRPVKARYAIAPNGVAIIEMAEASGLTLLAPEERNPMLASSHGTGLLIADALSRGCRDFMVGVGGSASCDAGMGMLSALGVKFFDASDTPLPSSGINMTHIAHIDASNLLPGAADARFRIIADVDNPLFGPEGAACIYAPQKGASPEQVRILDDGLKRVARLYADIAGQEVATIPGSGAAGGIAAAFSAFLKAEIQSGVDAVLDIVQFDNFLREADMVFTGEGRLDSQSLRGKLPSGVLRRAAETGVPVVAIAGCVENIYDVEDLGGFTAIFQAAPSFMPLEQAMLRDVASHNIAHAAACAFLSLFHGHF